MKNLVVPFKLKKIIRLQKEVCFDNMYTHTESCSLVANYVRKQSCVFLLAGHHNPLSSKCACPPSVRNSK